MCLPIVPAQTHTQISFFIQTENMWEDVSSEIRPSPVGEVHTGTLVHWLQFF